MSPHWVLASLKSPVPLHYIHLPCCCPSQVSHVLPPPFPYLQWPLFHSTLPFVDGFATFLPVPRTFPPIPILLFAPSPFPKHPIRGLSPPFLWIPQAPPPHLIQHGPPPFPLTTPHYLSLIPLTLLCPLKGRSLLTLPHWGPQFS